MVIWHGPPLLCYSPVPAVTWWFVARLPCCLLTVAGHSLPQHKADNQPPPTTPLNAHWCSFFLSLSPVSASNVMHGLWYECIKNWVHVVVAKSFSLSERSGTNQILYRCQEQLNKNSFITIIFCHGTQLLTDQVEFTIPSSLPWKDFSKIYKSLIFLGSEVYLDNFRLSSFCCF